MADARYKIIVPKHDLLGQPLVDVASYAHQHVFQNHKHKNTVVDPCKRMLDPDGSPQMVDHLVTIAEDTPETDGHMKQLAAYVAEVANHPGVHATKDGKGAPVHWFVNNLDFKPGQGAGSEALAQTQVS